MAEQITKLSFDVEIEEDVLSEGEKVFVAVCLQIPIASQGATIEEAAANIHEALELWLDTASETEVQKHIPELREEHHPIFRTRIEVPYGQIASAVGG